MIFMVAPLYKKADRVWFNDTNGNLRYGVIDTIGAMWDAQGVRYYYTALVDCGNTDEEIHTIRESDIAHIHVKLPQPKYRVGENIRFTWSDKEKQHMDDGLIERIDISICEDNHIDIKYIIDEDSEFWIYEDEVLGFAESMLDDKEDKVAPV